MRQIPLAWVGSKVRAGACTYILSFDVLLGHATVSSSMCILYLKCIIRTSAQEEPGKYPDCCNALNR